MIVTDDTAVIYIKCITRPMHTKEIHSAIHTISLMEAVLKKKLESVFFYSEGEKMKRTMGEARMLGFVSFLIKSY